MKNSEALGVANAHEEKTDAGRCCCGGLVGGPSDTDRLDLLAELMQHCPHAELTYNDDQDEGLVGYGINVDGCEPISIFNSTLRGAIDQLRKELDRRDD